MAKRKTTRRRTTRRGRRVNGKKERLNRPAGEDARIIIRRVKALKLRVEGARYKEIARETHVSLKTAYDDVQDELRAVQAITGKKAEELIGLEVERLDCLLRALKAGIAKGDPRSIDSASRLSERRSKLLGLDAAANAPPVEEILRTASMLVSIIQTHVRDQAILDAIADQFETALGGISPTGVALLPPAPADHR